MKLSTAIKNVTNAVLRPLNARIETLTADRVELDRLRALERKGHFDQPVIHVPELIRQCHYQGLLSAVQQYDSRFESFRVKGGNDVGYSYDNAYFSSPDVEILYTMLRQHRPKRVIEIGSGNSTRIMRQAIIDGGFPCKITSVDPAPRLDVVKIADEVIPKRVEWAKESIPFGELASGDILFIDSSHEVRTGNDVILLFLKILPELRAGTLVHIHDVFLPYDYPREWVVDERWEMGEQYLLAPMLFSEGTWEVLWPGYYVQKTHQGFHETFASRPGGRAQSFWIRKLG
jgi:hypothetical protein